MDRKGNGTKDDVILDELRPQLSVSTSISTGGERTSKLTEATQFFFKNIRFIPKVIEFIDAFEGKQFTVDISIQNVGKNPTTIKIGEPNSFIFQLKKPSKLAILLAAGCSVNGTVSYTYHNDDLVQSSQIPVQVDGKIIYYPIIVKPAQPEIQVQPQKLHFKVINLGASAKSMKLNIKNNGGIRTKYEVDLGKNPLGLVVHPMRGTLKAKQSTDICVEMMGLLEGEYYQELWLYTADTPIRVPVLVEVVWPRLKITYPKGTEEMTLIDFRPTFIGTQRVASFTLKNFGAESSSYVILAEVNGELEILKKAKDTIEGFGMFIFGAEESILQPFENRILNVLFCPKTISKTKGWPEKEKSNQKQREYIVFVRINRVHCLEWKELAKIDLNFSNAPVVEDRDSYDYKRSSGNTREGLMNNFPMPNSEPRLEILRVCLHGLAVEPDILIQPSSFDFGELNVGDKRVRVLAITNSSVVAVKCVLCKTANVKTTPNEIWLKSEKTEEFQLSLMPTSPGAFNVKMKVNILAKSDVAFNSDKKMELVAVYNINFSYVAKPVVAVLSPKVGLGITPVITDEVGLQKDLIKYKNADQLPFAAVLGLKQGFKPTWMINEKDQINNVESAIIALPNDRPKYYATWPKDKICRAIFTGFFRYSPPEDLSYTFSPDERNKKDKHCAMWNDYIDLLKKLRLEKIKLKNLKCYLDYDVSCKKHFGLKRYKGDSIAEICSKNIKGFKLNNKQSELVLKNPLIPLSGLYLIRINVYPKLINFNLVAVNTKAQELVTVSNTNSFPISLKFTSGNSAVSVMNDKTFTVQPMSTKSVYVMFETNALGRYFGFLNYIINGCHEFEISIFAFVTPKVLVVKSEDMSIEIGKHEPKDAFQPRSIYLPIENFTQAPVKYKWGFANDSVLTAEIMQGEVPPRSELLVEILYHLNPTRSFYSEVKFISENGTENLIKLIHPSKKVAVHFLEQSIKMQNISLNLPTKVDAVIQNDCYHDVVFELINVNPMPGVTVGPKEGIIKRRSSLSLEINIQIPIVMKFVFEVVVIVHFSNRISVTVTGNVVAPNIRMRPSQINVRKLCALSVDVFSICVENLGTSPAEVTLDLQQYPEFTIGEDYTRLYLLPNKSLKVFVHFEPENASRYVFYFPFVINNILGPPSMQDAATEFASYYIAEHEDLYQSYGVILPSKELKLPCVTFNCTITAALLNVSPSNLYFTMGCDNRSAFQPQNIEIVNVHTEKVIFCIRNDDLGEINNSPFNLVPLSHEFVENRLKSIKITLEPDKRIILKATFDPKKPGAYNVDIPIFIKGYNEGFVFNFIHMTGLLKPPRIDPDVKEINFPPVPLGVGTETIVNVKAENYHSSDYIKYAICYWFEGESDGVPPCLTAEWIQEPYIAEPFKSNVFQLRVNFEGFLPIALRTYILLIDSNGQYSSILVTAVADNSSLTNYAFLRSRVSNYKIIRDTPVVPKLEPQQIVTDYPLKKTDLKWQEKTSKPPRHTKSKSSTMISYEEGHLNSTPSATNNPWPADKGPKLVIQMTKSMSRITELNFVNIYENLEVINDKIVTPLVVPKKNSLNSISSLGDSQTSSMKFPSKMPSLNSVAHVDSSFSENSSKYFPDTRDYVERWIFEVVMRCEQYFLIPQSFQTIRKVKPATKKTLPEKNKETPITKDFLDILKEIVGNDKHLPERPIMIAGDMDEINHVFAKRAYFGDILDYLRRKGCFLPHIRPEYLLSYELYADYFLLHGRMVELFSWSNYELKAGNSSKATLEQASTKPILEKDSTIYQNSSIVLLRESWKKLLFEELSLAPEAESEKVAEPNLEPTETSKQHLDWTWDLIGKQFEHEVEIIDKQTFDLISTQAWLDIVIQIFRVFILKKIVWKKTIPQVVGIEMTDKIATENANLRSVYNYGRKTKDGWALDSESFNSNIYSCQEQTLLNWLNEHLQIQKGKLWDSKDECFFKTKVINNFDKDLSDSVALLSVTASHCPYILSTHLNNVFLKPDTPNKIQHNAGKLIEAWRTLEVGVTLETSDIVRPNAVYMLMLVAHLYEVLPTLHPHSFICFSAPLNAEVKRKICIKNNSDKKMTLKPKFFGEYEGYFSLTQSVIDIKPSSSANINIKFQARKIKNVSAVLFLSGCIVSPNFANSLTYYLDGEPSEIPECEKFTLSLPLYKVICSEIPLNPPFPDSATYEVWYTTKEPQFKGSPDVQRLFTPWSQISNRKISRRLFLNKSEIEITENVPATVSVTITCFTNENRSFWLLFRSRLSDFIIQIEIKPKILDDQMVVKSFYSESWSPSSTCLCPIMNNLKPSNCPFLTELRIPTRNEDLWYALRTMFFKTLLPQEKSFWNKHFEMDIGLCLILWLLRPDEEEEVLEEFVQVLPTKVNYTLSLEPDCNYVTVPPSVEILDVRENAEVVLPIHISSDAPETFNFKLTMTSENNLEIRSLNVYVEPLEYKSGKIFQEEPNITNSLCQPARGEILVPCKDLNNSKILKRCKSKIKSREINLSS